MMGIVGIKNQTCATVLYLFKIGIDLSEFKKIAELKKLYYPYPYIMFHQFTSLRSPISCTDLFGNIQREGSLRKIWNARCAFGISKAWVAKVRARTHVCDVWSHICVCVQKRFTNICAMCVCGHF